MINAVIFDMDGLLLDSEPYWSQARSQFCRSRGCEWREADELAVKGNNSPEWAAAIRRRCALDLDVQSIIAGVTSGMRELYSAHVPLLRGAIAAVHELRGIYPLAIASSSPVSLIEFTMEAAGLRDCFRVVVSADEASRGKPAPDVFLMTAERLGYEPNEIVVFEDSTAGITAASAAGMHVIAVPNPNYPPLPAALARAHLVLPSLEQFRPEMLARNLSLGSQTGILRPGC